MAFFLCISIPTASYAQSQTTQQQIDYLYSIVVQLQAQLAALQANNSNSDNSDIVNAVTEGVSVSSDEVVMEGKVEFDEKDSVRAWFEYGTSQSVTQSTQSVSFTGSANSTKSVLIAAPVIENNQTYYFRMVAEDSDEEYSEGAIKSFYVSNYDSDDNNNDEDAPSVSVEDADDVDENSAELAGDVDMNNFNNGTVFFVYGEDENDVEDAADEDQYSDIDTNGLDIMKTIVDSDLDDDDTYNLDVSGLDEDTNYFFRICVEYDDEDNDETLECSSVEELTTDEN